MFRVTVTTAFAALALLLVGSERSGRAASKHDRKILSELPKGKDCVAYKATKGMFWVADVDVVGVNCAIRVTVRETETDRHLTVSIPVKRFDSGLGARDEHVAEILGGPNLQPMSFSAVLPKNDEDAYKVVGALSISGQSRQLPIELERVDKTDQWTFVVRTRFGALGLKPPSVGVGGVIAEAQDGLVLFGSARNPATPTTSEVHAAN